MLQIGVSAASRVEAQAESSRAVEMFVAGVGSLQQYFAGHPVEYVTTVFFFMGLAVLGMKLLELFSQPWHHSPSQLVLGPQVQGGQSVETAETLLSRLDTLPRGRQNRFFVERLREILEWVRRRNSAEGLEDELKYVSEREADRVHDSYALFRVIIWAIPVLGFLGTVIGITLALANLSPTAIEDSLPLTISALSIAFATTTQALSLSIVLMFAQYLIGQIEGPLFARIDRWMDEELLGRFEQIASDGEGQLAAVRRMSETMIDASEHLVRRQTELWRAAIDVAHQRWNELTGQAEVSLGKALARSLNESLQTHAQTLAAAESAAADRNQARWQEVQQALVDSAGASAALQQAVNEQVDILRGAVEATGQVARLEEALNRNLNTLAGAKHFEQTVMSLAAAIHLLNARLEEMPGRHAGVELKSKKASGQAA
ncbi:MAG: MotA/TolQ/ExbB proton channel family protein [Pirellulaceae bacterium]|nr:MotA/TolQ/ExbB proton channel family protein [Pirellulaceae bacterium]